MIEDFFNNLESGSAITLSNIYGEDEEYISGSEAYILSDNYFENSGFDLDYSFTGSGLGPAFNADIFSFTKEDLTCEVSKVNLSINSENGVFEEFIDCL